MKSPASPHVRALLLHLHLLEEEVMVILREPQTARLLLRVSGTLSKVLGALVRVLHDQEERLRHLEEDWKQISKNNPL